MKETNAVFTPINKEKWGRKPYFDYYMERIKSKYTLTVQMDISPLIQAIQKQEYRFFPTFLFAIMKGINQNESFRMGYDAEGQLGHWQFLHPSYTIFHPDDQTFSDIWSEYSADFQTFYQNVTNDMEIYKGVKGISTKPGAPPNFCSVSSIPWLSFSGFAQDTYEASQLLTPLIRFGKYYQEGDKTLIPFAIFVNHAVADGYHTAKLINEISDIVSDVKEWIL